MPLVQYSLLVCGHNIFSSVCVSLSRELCEVDNVLYFYQTRIDLEAESAVTQLVFEHAIRIRLKSDSLQSKTNDESAEMETTRNSKGKGVEPTTPSAEGTQTPGNASDDSVGEAMVPSIEGGHAKSKTASLIGKINDLITTDLEEIEYSYNFVTIREFNFLV